MAKYLGELKVVKEQSNEDGDVTLSFKNHADVTLESSLYALVSSEAPMKGASVTDVIIHTISVKFLQELASYNLDYYFIKTIGTKLEVLAHNLSEDLLRRTFYCSGGDSIALRKIV